MLIINNMLNYFIWNHSRHIAIRTFMSCFVIDKYRWFKVFETAWFFITCQLGEKKLHSNGFFCCILIHVWMLVRFFVLIVHWSYNVLVCIQMYNGRVTAIGHIELYIWNKNFRYLSRCCELFLDFFCVNCHAPNTGS